MSINNADNSIDLQSSSAITMQLEAAKRVLCFRQFWCSNKYIHPSLVLMHLIEAVLHSESNK
ncbi:hypothetical protein E2C01_088660 [Portunus trituberculatus]|uniref:Uncharacterized protein n=1 Tax=Portunus trituberculatus TaxID=210409 RepID=A0A5B7JKF8_PORTR|nr:hypothetical protein [Portunus trituberculatus]